MKLAPIQRRREGGKFIPTGYTDGLTPSQRMEKRNPGYRARISAAYRKRHPDRVLASHRRRVESGKIKAYYRIWNRRQRAKLIDPLFKAQNGLCAVCYRKLQYPNLDHNHKCCKPKGGGISGCSKCRRGLLCGSCNGALHLVENKRLLKAAIAYLKKWETQ